MREDGCHRRPQRRGAITAAGERALPVGAHLVGSVPLGSAEEVISLAAGALGDRLRRIPDGETGPRSDWIMWQYPVFSSRSAFEIGPPDPTSYRMLPRLRLSAGEHVDFDDLGYAQAASASYSLFARLKRDGVVPAHCRFQVCLPTPLAPVAAFVAAEDRAAVEPVYEARMLEEVERLLAAVPTDQLAIQWDARFEFAMLEASMPAWFPDVRAGVLDRLLRLSHSIPDDVELGYHLCYGDEAHGHFCEPADARKLTDVANALATGVDRPLNWIHMPVPHDRTDDEWFAPLAELELSPETELYLGLVHTADGVDGALERVATAGRHAPPFGVASDCGWGRGGREAVDRLLELHLALSRPIVPIEMPGEGFAWPKGFTPVPSDGWTGQAVADSGLTYDHVERHGWYANLDPTVDDLAAALSDGDILMDYSGGTGILLDRLRLRIFGRQVGTLIVDASPKFLRVALEKYHDDPLVALRLLRFLGADKRLQRLDEVLEPALLAHGVDAIACTNAIHLYPDFGATCASWVELLRPGGKVFINSGNLRNPRAGASEWIIDETVWVINDLAEGIVRSDPRYARYRAGMDDPERMARHAKHRNRVFIKPRPLEYYVETLKVAGLTVDRVREQAIAADVGEWHEFLTAYHDAVLGWVGGTRRIDGAEPDEQAVEDRLELMRLAMQTLFGGRPTFDACWTYITATKPG